MLYNALNSRHGTGSLVKELSESPQTIVYLGNSITAQKESYRNHLHSRIVRHFNKIHRPVNAGFGGVGSLACAFLVHDLVLRHHPALCFVECSAADTGGATPLDSVAPSVEGILRQLISAGTRVVLLHLFRKDNMAVEKHTVLEIYESLADLYKVPSINLDYVISEQLASGNIEAHKIFHDGIHTTRDGAIYIGQLIFSWFSELLDQPETASCRMPSPFHPLPFQYTWILPVMDQMIRNGGSFQRNKYRDLLDYSEIQPGIQLTVNTKQYYLRGVLIIADQDSGVVKVETPNSTSSFQTWDEWCIISRLQVIIFDVPVLPGSAVQIHLSKCTRGEKAANGSENRNEHQGKNLKIIGFMMYSPHHIAKKNLFD